MPVVPPMILMDEPTVARVEPPLAQPLASPIVVAPGVVEGGGEGLLGPTSPP